MSSHVCSALDLGSVLSMCFADSVDGPLVMIHSFSATHFRLPAAVLWHSLFELVVCAAFRVSILLAVQRERDVMSVIMPSLCMLRLLLAGNTLSLRYYGISIPDFFHVTLPSLSLAAVLQSSKKHQSQPPAEK